MINVFLGWKLVRIQSRCDRMRKGTDLVGVTVEPKFERNF